MELLIHSQTSTMQPLERRAWNRDLGHHQFDGLLVFRLIVILSRALHAALLLATHEHMGIYEGRFVSGDTLGVNDCIFPGELKMISRWIMHWQGSMARQWYFKVCKAELWACMLTQNSDLTLDIHYLKQYWLIKMLFRDVVGGSMHTCSYNG